MRHAEYWETRKGIQTMPEAMDDIIAMLEHKQKCKKDVDAAKKIEQTTENKSHE